MESSNKLIIETAPPNMSTYEEGSAGIKDKQPEDEHDSFSFYEALQRGGLIE